MNYIGMSHLLTTYLTVVIHVLVFTWMTAGVERTGCVRHIFEKLTKVRNDWA